MRPRDETRALRDAIATSNGATDVERGRESIAGAKASSASASSSSSRAWVLSSALVVVAGACACYAGRAGANATSLMMSTDIDARRVATAPFGARLGSTRSSSHSQHQKHRSSDDDEDEDSSLGMDEENDAPPFAAVKGLFSYERWFRSFSSGKTPGESSRDKKRSGGEDAIQDSPRHGAASAEGWKDIRRRLKSPKRTKLIVMLRHGEAAHNAWGQTIKEDLKTLPCSWHADGDLLDPSLTEIGVDQIVAARASLLGEDGVLSEIGAKEGSIRVLASPLSRTMETALIATNGATQLETPIVVTDYLRERMEMNTPFEVRRPLSVGDEMTPASKAIARTHVPHCKFKKGLKQLYGDELFDISVKSNKNRHKDCRVDRTEPRSYGHCKSLALTHESDFDLGDVEEETMLGMMSRVKIVLANIFDTYDESVVMLVTHSDWIIAALMELYPDTLGFVPRNGEVVPILVEDRRESRAKHSKVSKGAKPTKKHNDDDEEEDDEKKSRGKSLVHASSKKERTSDAKKSSSASKSKSVDKKEHTKKASKDVRREDGDDGDDYPASKKVSKKESSTTKRSKKTEDKTSKKEKSSKGADADVAGEDSDAAGYPGYPKSSKALESQKHSGPKKGDDDEKKKPAALGNTLSERIIASLKNFHDHLAKYDDDANDKPSESMDWNE